MPALMPLLAPLLMPAAIAAAAPALPPQQEAGQDEPAMAVETVVTVPAAHRLIEGIASDGETVWLSSVVDRQILVWRDGGLADVIVLPADLPRPLGIAYDATRGWLWIAGDCPAIDAPGSCEGGALVAIDRAGVVKARLVPGVPAHFGDVSVAGGVVTVGDSANGAVYACDGDCAALREVIPPGSGKSAQSSVRSADGRRLIVADYSLGILSVADDGARTVLLREDGRPLRGVDGLVRAGDWYVGIQNSQSPGVVFAFRLASDGAHIVDLRVLLAGEWLPDPTQLVVAGARILIVADAQWAAFLPPADPAAQGARTTQHDTRILAIPAPR